jgi:hypothetical protein
VDAFAKEPKKESKAIKNKGFMGGLLHNFCVNTRLKWSEDENQWLYFKSSVLQNPVKGHRRLVEKCT